MRAAFLLIALMLLDTGAGAQAIRNDRELLDSPEYEAWAKFPPGTVVKRNVGEGVETIRLLEVSPAAIRLERDFGRKGPGNDRPQRVTIAAKFVGTRGVADGGWEEKGEETLKINGREILCRVHKVESHVNGPRGEAHKVGTRWLSGEVPGRLVQEETRNWGNIGVKGTFVDATTSITLQEIHIPQADAAPPKGLPDAKQIHELIGQLEAADPGERERASVALEAAGEPALLHLRKVVDDLPPESRNRAAAIIRKLEPHAATRVTLKLKGVAAREAFAELSRAANIEFRTESPNLWKRADLPKVTIDAAGRPFWEVLREMQVQTGIGIGLNPHPLSPSRRPITLTEPSDRGFGWAASADGKYLQVLQHTQPQFGVTGLSINLFAEPGAWVLQCGRHALVYEAADDVGGKPALVGLGSPSYDVESLGEFPPFGAFAHTEANLHGGEAGGRITRARGATRLLVASEVLTAEFPDILAVKDATRELSGRRMTVQKVEASGVADGNYTVTVTVYRDSRDSAVRELGVGWWGIDPMRQFPRERLTLYDGAGRALLPTGDHRQVQPISVQKGGVGMSPNDAATFRFTFTRADQGQPQGPPGAPVKLVWEIGAGELREIQVPFDFKEIRPIVPKPRPTPQPPGKPPTKLSYTYQFDPPGLRTWSRVDDENWEERWETGEVIKFKVKGRINEGGLVGLVLIRLPREDLEVYVPDRGAGDWIRYRTLPDGKWTSMAKIEKSE